MTAAAPPPPSKRKLLIGGAVGVAAAAVIVVCFVLPAEFGIDPTGMGEATGLIKIAEPENPYLAKGLKRKGVLALSDTPLEPEPGASDHWQFELAPYEAIELKYEIEQGRPMVFRWQASAPLHYDMHAHPFDGGTALTESYAIEDARQSLEGRYVAAFTGIHGWYWQNRTLDNVTLTLDASGAMKGSRIFDQLGEHPRELAPSGSRANDAGE
jgi:hypothetical protein